MNHYHWHATVCLIPACMLGLILACGLGRSASSGATPPPTVSETRSSAPIAAVDKWGLWTGDTQLRGANVYQRRVYPELDDGFLGPGPVGPPFTQEDFDGLAALGANYVNVSHPGLFTETVPYTLDLDIQDNLDNLLTMIAQADMFAVISFRTGPGRAEFSVCCLGDDWFDESYYNDSVWQDQNAQNAWVEMWRYTAQRYRDVPIVVGYDLMVEPNSNEVGSDAISDRLDIWDPGEFYASYGGTLYDWNQLYPRIVAAIREMDADTPILIGGMGYSGIDWLPYLEPVTDTHTLYTVHQYAPHLYTHQPPDTSTCTYPGTCDTDWDGDYDDPLNRTFLDGLLTTVDDFITAHNAPVAVNEFGVMRWEPGADEFMDDQVDLFEERGLNHALWAWEPSWELWAEEVTAFNFRYGPDPENITPISNALQSAITTHWTQNTIRPSTPITFTPVATIHLPLIVANAAGSSARVEDFLYQLQNLALTAIGDTAYDLVVMDYSADGSAAGEFTAAQIDALKQSPGGDKIVLAYMSIGEAEDYRFYWQEGWAPGNPAWLDEENPDWEGNYKVHYWDPSWQTIVFSYTDRLLDAGFDGAYLDIIDAYEYYEDRGRTTAAQEMADFVAAIRAHARDPDFYIFPQNAPELAEGIPAYLDTIDGIGQEDIYYGYDTDDAMMPPAVTAELEAHLDLFKNAGKLVLTVDYASKVAHIDDAYAKSQAKGYVPFVTVRDLDQLIINPGHEPD